MSLYFADADREGIVRSALPTVVFLGVRTLNSTSPLNVSTEPIADARGAIPAVGGTGVAMRPLALFSIGHLTIDLYASLVATLQPVLVRHYVLSLTQAGVLGGVFMFSSSILQLAFGLVSDRMNRPVFVLASPVVAGVFLCSLGLADGFPDLLALIFLGGLGVAAFHPQGAAGVAAIARHRRGLVLAIFVTCGTIGHSIGPVFFSRMTEWLGLEMLYWAALPGLIVSGILLWGLPARESAATPVDSRFDYEAIRAKWKPLLLYYSIVLLRSVVQVGMAQFMTLYLYRERELSFRHASLGLSAFFASAALGSFMGGSLADRFGSRRVVVSSMIISIPFLALFVWRHRVGLFPGLVYWWLCTAFDEPSHSGHGAGARSHPGEHGKRIDNGFCLGSRRDGFRPAHWLARGPFRFATAVLGAGCAAAAGRPACAATAQGAKAPAPVKPRTAEPAVKIANDRLPAEDPCGRLASTAPLRG